MTNGVNIMFQHTPKLLMMMLWALMCHHVSAFQEIVLEAPGQSASSSEAIYLNPTLNATNYRHHTRGHYGKNCGRALTQYQAAELWRGYCNEDCSMNRPPDGSRSYIMMTASYVLKLFRGDICTALSSNPFFQRFR